MNIIKRDNSSKEVERFVTGLYSFDRAFADSVGNIGLPLRGIFEIAGDKGVGKTSVAFSLSGMIAAKYGRNITLIDFERQNPSTVENCLNAAGFSGDVDWVTFYSDGKNTMTANDALDTATKKCYEDSPDVVIVDSIGAFQPEVVHEGNLGDANMGKKAWTISQWFTRTLKPLIQNKTPNVVFYTNHVKPVFGGFRSFGPPPMESSGGRAVGYLSTQSIDIKRLFGYDFQDVNGWILEGKVDKNRDGFRGRKFYIYMQAGEGVHVGLTAMFECIIAGLAQDKGKKVVMDGVDYGKIVKIIENRHNDPSFFNPFINALASQGVVQEEDEVDSESKPKKKSKKSKVLEEENE